jgi:hypothetical protein
MSEMAKRLREARINARYLSASAAARAHGWRTSTYIAHENGQNDFDAGQAQEYAKAFKTDAEWLILGRARHVSGIDAELRQLPPEDAEKLIQEFNNMIRAVRLIRQKK